jgi:hypothetical protein
MLTALPQHEDILPLIPWNLNNPTEIPNSALILSNGTRIGRSHFVGVIILQHGKNDSHT